MGPNVRQMSEGFGGTAFQDITYIHPFALAAVFLLGIMMLTVSRRWSVLPMLLIACFISSVQKITVAGLDFNLLRIMVLFGVARLILRKEYTAFKWGKLDTAVVLWSLSSMLIYSLQQGTFSAVVNRLGFGFDAFGMYFLFRCLIQKWTDVDRIILGLITISVILAVFFVFENRTGRNLFSIFGGVPAVTIVRDGRLRCQGAFAHPIIAGCFWASLIPLLAAYWKQGSGRRIQSAAGVFACLVIIVCCASSTPLMGVAACGIGMFFFFFRRYMRTVRWSLVILLVSLHIVMKAPVWHLIARVSAVGGSTGYFRYMLIDSAISHFNEWALLGTRSTAHWFWGAQDLCNQYVFEAATGGFLTLCCFVSIIVVAFHEVGRLCRVYRRDSFRLFLSWALGVSLLIHCSVFIGISYFGQVWVVWYLLLAMIGSLSASSGGYFRHRHIIATRKQAAPRHQGVTK